MAMTIQNILIITCCLICINTYTIEGRWTLTSQNLDFISHVQFQFQYTHILPSFRPTQDHLGTAEPNPASIIPNALNQLTVYACSTITYNYQVLENSLFLSEISTSSPNRACANGEISEIKDRLSSIFYFQIIKNTLNLVYASNEVALVLTRVDKSKDIFVNGSEWSTKELILNNKNLIKTTNGTNDDLVYINNTNVYACGFNVNLKINLNANGQLQPTILKDQCQIQERNTAYAKLSSVFFIQPASLVFYDATFQKIMTLQFVAYVNGSAFDILFHSSNNSHSQNNSNEIIFSNNLGDYPTESPIESQCKCLQISNASLPQLNSSQLINKWYFYYWNNKNSQSNEMVNVVDLYYYFVIITQERMILYGGCQVKWINYTITSNNTLVKVVEEKVAKKSHCITPNLDQTVFQPFFKQVQYVSLYPEQTGQVYLNFYDANLQHIVTFTTNSPYYPSNWP